MSHTYKDRTLFIDRLERKFQRKLHSLNARKWKDDDERDQHKWDLYLYIDENEDDDTEGSGHAADRRREISEW